MKTSELKGSALDWAVAKCEGATCKPESAWTEVIKTGRYSYSTDWARGGPIIERAAMRCYVASKLGDDVEIPKELS